MFLDPNKPIEKHSTKLPHWQQGNTWIFVTWRLADSLPQSVVTRWKEQRDLWLTTNPEPHTDEQKREYSKRFTLALESYLDDAHGSCLLKTSSIRDIVTGAFHHFNGERYQLTSYVVMPNHVHILFRPLHDYRLADIVKNWKGYTAREINKALEKKDHTVWQADYWDRLIRSKKHFDWVTKYIEKKTAKLHSSSFTLYMNSME